MFHRVYAFVQGNQHRLGLLMKVDEEYKEKIEEEERKLLAQKVNGLDEAQKKAVYEQVRVRVCVCARGNVETGYKVLR